MIRTILLFMLASLPLLALADEVILGEGTILTPGSSLQTSDGSCRLKLQRDGNLIARRRGPFWGKPGTSDPIEDSISWTSGAHENGNYYARLQNDGNLQVIRLAGSNDEVVFTTNVYPPKNGPAGTHDLVFTDKCTLRIIRTLNDGSTDRIWSNIHEWFDNFSAVDYPGLDNVLAKGEYYTYPTQNYGRVCGTGADFCYNVPFSLRLQHDCNLVVFVGHDHGDQSAVVWSANVARPNADNCYLLVDSHDVALYEGTFDVSLPEDTDRPGQYWSVPSNFFDVDGYGPGQHNTYQVLINNEGHMYLDWD